MNNTIIVVTMVTLANSFETMNKCSDDCHVCSLLLAIE